MPPIKADKTSSAILIQWSSETRSRPDEYSQGTRIPVGNRKFSSGNWATGANLPGEESHPSGIFAGILHEKAFKLRLSGHELYNTNPLILLVKNMLCSKLHSQIFFQLKLFSYKIGSTWWRMASQCHPSPAGLGRWISSRNTDNSQAWFKEIHYTDDLY